MRLHKRTELKGFRRDLRRHPTRAEAVLWRSLRTGQIGGHLFRRQHSVGRYIVDFYCSQARLVIELDGSIHNDPLRTAHDGERQAWLEAQGLRVLRLQNEQVLRQLDLVVQGIAQVLADPRSFPGEGEGMEEGP